MMIVASSLMIVASSLPAAPWLDSSLPIAKRVALLMNEMTLTERARQTYAVHNLPQFVGDFKKSLGATSFGSLKLSAISTRVALELATRWRVARAEPPARACPSRAGGDRASDTPQ